MKIFWEIKKLSKMKINIIDTVLATSFYCMGGIEVKLMSQIRAGWARSEGLEVVSVGNFGQ